MSTPARRLEYAMIALIAVTVYAGLALTYLVAIRSLRQENIPLPPLTGWLLREDDFDVRLLVVAIIWPVGFAALIIDFSRHHP